MRKERKKKRERKRGRGREEERGGGESLEYLLRVCTQTFIQFC